MIPIHLSIQGLYSYQDKQEIDFTRLTEAGLFGIFGAVGSGKTTILEAMSLCLYGRTERFNLHGDDRYYNMLNLKVSEGLMSFIFLAGSDSKKFRADVKLRRNRNKYEEVKLQDHSYYLIEYGQDPMPVDQQTVLHSVGISYDNFKRTLVIPQGQFREFLELKPRERTEMLKELFGLHRFDRAVRVQEIAAENKRMVTEIDGALSQLVTSTDAELLLLDEKLSTITADLERWKGQQAQCNAQLQTAQVLKLGSESLQKAHEQLASLQQAVEADAMMLHRIDRFEQLRERYAILLRDLDALVIDLQTNQRLQDRLLLDRMHKEQASVSAGRELSTATQAKEEAEALLPRADELGKMADIRRMAQEINDLRALIRKEEARIESGKQKVQAEEDVIRIREEDIERLKASLLPDDRVFALRQFYRDLDRLNEAVERDAGVWHNKRQQLDVKLTDMQARRNKLPVRISSPLPDVLTEDGILVLSEATIAGINAEKETLRVELTKIALRKGLQHYAEGLVEGDPCILCGATHHPNPLHLGHPDAETLQVQQSIDELIAAERTVRFFVEDINKCIRSEALAAQEMESAGHALQRAREAVATHRSSLMDERFGPDAKLVFESCDAEFTRAKTAISAAETAIRTHRNNVSYWTKGLIDLQHGTTAAQLRLTAGETRYEVAVQGLQHLDLLVYLSKDVNEIEQERSGIVSSIEDARHRHESVGQLTKQLETELVDLNARIDQSAQALASLVGREQALHADLQARLLADGLPVGEVRDVLKWNPDLTAIRKGIGDRRQQVATIEGRLQMLEQQMAGRSYDAQLHLEAQEAGAEADEQVHSLTEGRGAIDEAIRKMRADLESRRRLEADHEQLNIRGRDISTLQEMFRGNGFVHFISQRYLENVVAVANKRFCKMVRDKFSIELSADGDFLVRDYLNDGRTRLLKSLSGGQTFQAALCLALALSENIQHTAGADQHFFFIDEGFGSLDSSSLETVFATLRSLQQENKAVGVISHVAELQQGMDIYLQVENDPETGTRVFESWKDVR